MKVKLCDVRAFEVTSHYRFISIEFMTKLSLAEQNAPFTDVFANITVSLCLFYQLCKLTPVTLRTAN